MLHRSYIEADETYIGGKRSGGKRGRGAPDKSIIFGMLQRGGDVMTKVVPNVKKRSTVHTEELRSYSGLHISVFRLGRRLTRKDNTHARIVESQGKIPMIND